MSSTEQKIDGLLDRLQQERSPRGPGGLAASRPTLPTLNLSRQGSPNMSRPQQLILGPRRNDNAETENRLREIMKTSGDIKIDGVLYRTDIKDMVHIEELGYGTCGHVVKMRHNPSGKIIAVKQMRRSGNSEELKRIIMDIEVVLKSDCKYIVKCLGCFITESEVWICMELMDTCFDKLLKRLKQPVPEEVLGKVSVATVEALAYLKDQHNVIHRDVKPSNILLDTRGNVKLCDFGISGRLVDSLAKSRSAGCAAYMAPERIEPDPKNPDYDVRADVWSLGITLVELATGVFPYQDCKTDFEVLTKVIVTDPPCLPEDKKFSTEFREFVKCCLTKEKAQRPKYTKLKNLPFIKMYQVTEVNVGEWYVTALQRVNDRAAARHPVRQFFSMQQKPALSKLPTAQTIQNGSHFAPKPIKPLVSQLQSRSSGRDEDERGSSVGPQQGFHSSRLEAFQLGGSVSRPVSNNRSFSPLQAYQNHIAAMQQRDEIGVNKAYPVGLCSPMPQRKFGGVNSGHSSLPETRSQSETRWKSPIGSPLPLRSDFQSEEPQYVCGNTSPIILQRFYHQQKQQQLIKEIGEGSKVDPCKKRFASYIKMQLSGEKSGKSSRHQSPEPPPRTSRGHSAGDSQSPLALRRAFLETHTPNSPSLSRRYVQPAPPVPPPRRLSESTSVPGSPQHLRARFHYTPEPQRRVFQPTNDVPSSS
ncbi:dual specificity mitogen-activated protein kinase kinase 7-like isoform X2 [Anthonomus grandis grandis]|uniref:dual specificity mitogen-activated protein kinase kinase 7-like isoform X2 n=1 Tax=Anthonomus grandis grandis TaxID=2921223 RepID=UPI0021662550|nr:dual specificity mitogen-activated protein kinase kinase 7-like isoform X2 [Anthonomus grandis grandis]